MRASAAIPILFEPVTYNGTEYVDGGVAENVLTLHAISKCPPGRRVEVDVVLSMPLAKSLRPVRTRHMGLVDIALRALEIVVAKNSDGEINYKCPYGQRSHILARVHAPAADLGSQRAVLDFDGGAELISAGRFGPLDYDESYFCLPR